MSTNERGGSSADDKAVGLDGGSRIIARGDLFQSAAGGHVPISSESSVLRSTTACRKRGSAPGIKRDVDDPVMVCSALCDDCGEHTVVDEIRPSSGNENKEEMIKVLGRTVEKQVESKVDEADVAQEERDEDAMDQRRLAVFLPFREDSETLAESVLQREGGVELVQTTVADADAAAEETDAEGDEGEVVPETLADVEVVGAGVSDEGEDLPETMADEVAAGNGKDFSNEGEVVPRTVGEETESGGAEGYSNEDGHVVLKNEKAGDEESDCAAEATAVDEARARSRVITSAGKDKNFLTLAKERRCLSW